MNSLEMSDQEAAAVSVAPRVSLESMKAKIKSFHFTDGATAVGLPIEIMPDGNRAGLSLLTLCIMEMRNGFILVGQSAAASPANFNADLGKDLAFENAIRQLWPLEGYALREKLAAE